MNVVVRRIVSYEGCRTVWRHPLEHLDKNISILAWPKVFNVQINRIYGKRRIPVIVCSILRRLDKHIWQIERENIFFPKQLLDMTCQWKNKII
ncbi:hypothetical protein BpHYR1_012069 [Brachionus plicatilis]|uniref:Uncharacterized protein n=1 Tax=Brachionus plicatilis TaxID=10195 RepID=A0A3M7SSE0_BRAPC|nr:hypothetical protein BpHYR1_012069 [Brachionus plicatilis]